jgi:hypothetical protein
MAGACGALAGACALADACTLAGAGALTGVCALTGPCAVAGADATLEPACEAAVASTAVLLAADGVAVVCAEGALVPEPADGVAGDGD